MRSKILVRLLFGLRQFQDVKINYSKCTVKLFIAMYTIRACLFNWTLRMDRVSAYSQFAFNYAACMLRN